MSTTDAEDLSELTAFSLPPAEIPLVLTPDILAFEGENGRIRSKEQPLSIDTRKRAYQYWLQQSVGMSNEAPSIEDAIAAGAQDLENFVVVFAETLSLLMRLSTPISSLFQTRLLHPVTKPMSCALIFTIFPP